MTRGMRVAQLVETFSKLSETFVYDAVLALQKEFGFEQYVATSDRLNEDSRPFEPVHMLKQSSPPWVRASRFVERAFTPRVERFSRHWIGRRYGLRKMLDSHPVDVVHAHFGTQAVFALPVLGSEALVVSFYGHDISRLTRRPNWRRAYRSLFARASAICVLSDDMKRAALAAHAPTEKIHVVHLGRRIEQMKWRPPSRSVRRLISVGRLMEKKGHLELVEALAREGLEQLELEIIGEGPLRSVLEKRVSALGLNRRVRFAGAVRNDEALRRLSKADAFALTSRTASNGDEEGTPTVLVEAQALGLPCISTFHAGIPEMIPTENHALLAAEGDVESIADSLRSAMRLSVPELVGISRRGRAFVERGFDSNTIAAQTLDIYRRAQTDYEC